MHDDAVEVSVGERPVPSRHGAAARRVPDFCRTCALFHACAMVGYGRPELSPLHFLMEHLGPYRAGSSVLRQGDPFDAVYAVRAGSVKFRQFDRSGREHVLGFFLPGEVVGLGAIYPDQFPYDAVALDDVQLCRFPFAAISALAAADPAIQRHLFRLISKQLSAVRHRVMTGDYAADERMAAFLVELGRRYEARGLSGTRFRLSMSRSDIASYLRLAAETVSRSLGRLRDRGLIEIEGHRLCLLDLARLRELGGPLVVD